MQRTERTRVLHHSSLGLHCCSCPDQIYYSVGFLTPLSLKDVQFSFLFLYYAYPIILNDRLCRIYLFFLCCTFHCVNSKMLNEFSVLTRLIK